MNRHRALGCCLSMIFSENRFALFRIMLYALCRVQDSAHASLAAWPANSLNNPLSPYRGFRLLSEDTT
ncbi:MULTISPECIES: hypothetical protein [Bradyrhizobium]|uniref:hypothetical protein n=1 Tax=Bradyrhizobium TaxID=374 RepID=UPI000A040FFE|nr:MULTISPECIES: hypothetical protein [Bradyrhizobium]QOG20146.1 hypothetical protein FOM02_25125 [Bradyrhizobium sp. SEMIA]UFW52461.1 hypothetical protein BaraCB756_16325 [Bradyrhizobium arachidis]